VLIVVVNYHHRHHDRDSHHPFLGAVVTVVVLFFTWLLWLCFSYDLRFIPRLSLTLPTTNHHHHTCCRQFSDSTGSGRLRAPRRSLSDTNLRTTYLAERQQDNLKEKRRKLRRSRSINLLDLYKAKHTTRKERYKQAIKRMSAITATALLTRLFISGRWYRSPSCDLLSSLWGCSPYHTRRRRSTRWPSTLICTHVPRASRTERGACA
jgi:hypothetical protein